MTASLGVSWSNGLVGRQSPASEDVHMGAEDTVEVRHQATTGEDIAD
jgi:hypothetical protein